MQKQILKAFIFLGVFFILPNFSKAAIICGDNFDSYSAGAISGTKTCPSGIGSWSIDNTAAIVAGAGSDQSNAARITFSADQINRTFNYNPVVNLQEFWVKFNYKMDCMTGNCVGGGKFLKIFNGNGTEHKANVTMQVVYQTGLFEQLLYGCTGELRDANNVFTYNGGVSSCPYSIIGETTPGNIDPRDGQWHTWKFHMKYNDSGQNNGIFEVWNDDIAKVRVGGVNNRSDLAAIGADSIALGGWNQYYGGIPYYYYYDNFVVASYDPDLGADITSPALPTGLDVQ